MVEVIVSPADFGGRMPLRDMSHTSAPHGLVAPTCANCHRPDRVHAVDSDDVSPAHNVLLPGLSGLALLQSFTHGLTVKYLRCGYCGFVWAVREDLNL